MSAFGRVELLAASAGVIGLILFLFSSDPSSPPMVATPLKSSSKAPEKGRAFRKPAQRADAKRDEEVVPPFVPPVKAVPKPPVVDARYAQMKGLIGESSSWIESVFDNIYWEALGDNRFEHVNRTVMALSVESDKVIEMRMDFPPELPSPEMQNALDYALGRSTVSPFYLDELENAKTVLEGRFKHRDKFEITYSAGRSMKKGAKKLSGWLVFKVIR